MSGSLLNITYVPGILGGAVWGIMAFQSAPVAEGALGPKMLNPTQV